MVIFLKDKISFKMWYFNLYMYSKICVDKGIGNVLSVKVIDENF